MIVDAAGNLYGTTPVGGEASEPAGTVFELTRHGAKWTETLLHSFCYGLECKEKGDGKSPEGNLFMDRAGNLYGTTGGGGKYDEGIVYELTPAAGGEWTETILYNFCAEGGGECTDGSEPTAGVIMDAAGNLYGTTYSGGTAGGVGSTTYVGTVFELTRHGTKWTHTILYKFCEYPCDGAAGYEPLGALIMDPAGNLYGTTSNGGGEIRGGTVFELTPNAHGEWTEKTLYTFCSMGGDACIDGADPYAGVIMDRMGNLYGTTSIGGNNSGGGTVFELTPDAGTWTEKVIANFCFSSTCSNKTGEAPEAALTIDKAGNLYGTTYSGGNYAGGTVFELTPTNAAKTTWKEKLLASFCTPMYCTTDAAGNHPSAGVTLDKAGNLYGTTPSGGPFGVNFGAVFQLSP